MSVSGLWEHPTCVNTFLPIFCVTQVASSCLLQWQLYFASELAAHPPKAISWSQKSEAWGLVGYTPAKLNSEFSPEIPEFHKGWLHPPRS